MVKVGVLCQLMWLHEEPNCGWCARSCKTLKVVVAHRPQGKSQSGLAATPSHLTLTLGTGNARDIFGRIPV
jgi:hypothetical protein